MAKLTMHWQLGTEPLPADAHFFLYREGDDVHCDHRQYSRDELERRVASIVRSSGEVPAYYQAALDALADPAAPREGDVPLEIAEV